MTVSSIACWKNVPEILRRCLLLLWLILPGLGWAAEIEINEPQLVLTEEGYALSANFAFEFNQRLEEAVNKGVVLNFIADFEMSKPRWYWLDEKLLSRTQTYRLSYHALTRQYRLSTGGLHQTYTSLSDALAVLSRLRNWGVIDKSDKSLRPGESYTAALRLRLDISQLPRPFQLSALGNKEWSLSSDWKTWQGSLPVDNK
jgi:hypothetical protein